MTDYRVYEELGLKCMENYDDGKAREYLRQAASLGSEKAVDLLQYLSMGIADSDFEKTKVSQETEFDYDLVPLCRVSRIAAVLKKGFERAKAEIGYVQDTVVCMQESFFAGFRQLAR